MFGNSNKAFIIAEIGVNHNNNMEIAKNLICEAKNAGADAVKFQTFKGSNLSTKTTKKAPYQEIRDRHQNHLDMLTSLELSHENHYLLKQFCLEQDIFFISTSYTKNDAEFLVSLNIPMIKIASADIIDLQMLAYLASIDYPVIMSTGMANQEEISQALNLFKHSKNPPWLLHCISEYPTPYENANLRRILILKELFPNLVIGYSDHTLGSNTARMAFGLGSRIFEKHFTFDKNASGPDHVASADIPEFKGYVKAIRECELAYGSGSFEKTKNEVAMHNTSRKSLHYSKSLKKGHTILETDLKLIRPGIGFFWKDLDKFVGKKLCSDVNENDIVLLDNIVESKENE